MHKDTLTAPQLHPRQCMYKPPVGSSCNNISLSNQPTYVLCYVAVLHATCTQYNTPETLMLSFYIILVLCFL
jgi:hypothetical protein